MEKTQSSIFLIPHENRSRNNVLGLRLRSWLEVPLRILKIQTRHDKSRSTIFAHVRGAAPHATSNRCRVQFRTTRLGHPQCRKIFFFFSTKINLSSGFPDNYFGRLPHSARENPKYEDERAPIVASTRKNPSARSCSWPEFQLTMRFKTGKSYTCR